MFWYVYWFPKNAIFVYKNTGFSEKHKIIYLKANFGSWTFLYPPFYHIYFVLRQSPCIVTEYNIHWEWSEKNQQQNVLTLFHGFWSINVNIFGPCGAITATQRERFMRIWERSNGPCGDMAVTKRKPYGDIKERIYGVIWERTPDM